jgi:uncharacterized protein with HEPN domain
MEHDSRTFLWDAQASADAILEFIAGHTAEKYFANAMMRAAVERHFEIIGEALNRFAKNSPEIAATIPNLDRAVAFRNLLIHGYASIDDAIVWRTAQEDLPILRQAIATILTKMNDKPS